MNLIATLTLARVMDGKAEYVETRRGEHRPVVGLLSIDSEALSDPPPAEVRIAVQYREVVTGEQEGTGAGLPHPAEIPQPGDLVTVIKDTSLTGTKTIPRWLDEYLGRTGRVRWISAGGAMVEFDIGAAWFAYTELRVEK